MRPFVSALIALSVALALAGCAAMQKAGYDGSAPARVCPSTSEGGEAKTFCY